VLRFSREEKSIESFLKLVSRKEPDIERIAKRAESVTNPAEWGGKVNGAEVSAKHAGGF